MLAVLQQLRGLVGDFYKMAMYFPVFVVFFCLGVHNSQGAKPLEMPDSNRTVFEFHFVIDWKLTMTWYNETTEVGVLLRYDVDRGKYLTNIVEPSSGSFEDELILKEVDSKEEKARESEEENRVGSNQQGTKRKRQSSETCAVYKAVPKMDSVKLDKIKNIDGTHRRVIMVNGQVPAPSLVVPFGSEVVVKVTNNLPMEGMTIHFHGIDKKNQWFMDGTARLQQCPIASGSEFTYRFKADFAGTHFYHGHLGMDRAEGLYGPIIVMPEDRGIILHDGRKVMPDFEYSVILFDWEEVPTRDMWPNHQMKTHKFIFGSKENFCLGRNKLSDGTVIGGTYPLSAISINDKGWHDQSDIRNRPDQLDLETFGMEEGGKTYLFRVINAGKAHPLMVSVEDHKLEVVATDGAPIRGTPAEFLILYPGERYDFVLVSKEKPEKDIYYMIVETLDFYASKDKQTDPLYALARIKYGQPKAAEGSGLPDLQHKRCFGVSKCTVVNCPFPLFPSKLNRECVNIDQLQSVSPGENEILADSSDSQEYFVNMNYEEAVNGWLFQYPKGPPYFYPQNESLVMRPCTAENWNGFRESWCTYTLNITLGSVVQLNIFNLFGYEGQNNKEGYHHPIHLHGTHFYVLKVGYGGYNHTSGLLENANPDTKCATSSVDCTNPTWTNSSWLQGSIPGMNLKNPIFKDTVLVPLGGYVVLRFKADNPGWWLLHCHIMEHHMAGMAFAVRVGEHEQMPKPPSSFPTCGVFDAVM